MKHVKIVRSNLHPRYRVNGVGYDARVCGVSTSVLADQFLGGDLPEVVARWMGTTEERVYAALRWELQTRRQQLAAVKRAVVA